MGLGSFPRWLATGPVGPEGAPNREAIRVTSQIEKSPSFADRARRAFMRARGTMKRDQDFCEIKFDGKPCRVAPLLDVAKIELPSSVVVCPHCRAHAQLVQRWCDAPPSPGACDMCTGVQFVYEATGKPVPRSVREQIANANPGLVAVADVWTAYRICVDFGGRLFHREDVECATV